MASVAEMQDMCEEFARNFAALRLKYDATEMELNAERAAKGVLQQNVVDLSAQIERHKQEANVMARALEEARGVQDRLLESGLAIEHLKGRLETAKRSMEEKEAEHAIECAHLRREIEALLSQESQGRGASELKISRSQRDELEERCVALSGQLLEERERQKQQQVSTSIALRDVHARNMELDNRTRSAEGELAQLRSAMRRAHEASLEVQADAERKSLLCTRLEAEKEHLQRDVVNLRQSVAQLERQVTSDVLQNNERLAVERDNHQRQIAAITAQLEEASRQRVLQSERIAAEQWDQKRKADAVREECRAEMEELLRAKSNALDDVRRAHQRVRVLEAELNEARDALTRERSASVGLAAQRAQLEQQLEVAVQGEAWVAAEKSRVESQLANLQEHVAELEEQVRASEALQAANSTMALQLRYAESDLREAKLEIQTNAQQWEQQHAALTQRHEVVLRTMQQNVRSLKTQLKKSEQVRSRLSAIVAERDSQLMVESRQMPTRLPIADPLGMMRSQVADAVRLNEQLASLVH